MHRTHMKKGDFGLRFAAVVIMLALAPAAAMAYIDPGNGAYMVQALFTVVGAALFYLRHPIRSIKAFWHRFFGSGDFDGRELATSDDIISKDHQTLTPSERLAAGTESLRENN